MANTGLDYPDIQTRTNILNRNADKRSVLDSIDRPIRPLVIELNRIGMETTFSCCGYTYDNQEEPKSHGDTPYVLFKIDPLSVPKMMNFFKLASMSHSAGWYLSNCSNGREWCLAKMKDEIKWNKKDGLSEAIHDYEMKVIEIKKMTESILKLIPSASDSFIIKDGNEDRRALYGEEWITVPKKSVTIDNKEPSI